MATLTDLSPQQLREAADLQEQIASLQERLSNILGGKPTAAPKPAGSRKRVISAAGIARIRAAQKARWAKIKNSQSKGK